MRGEGFLADDDNEPVVENIPENQSNGEEYVCGYWSGNITMFCSRKSSGRRKEKATLIEPCDNSKLECFLRFVPKQWTENTATLETSKFLNRPLSFG